MTLNHENLKVYQSAVEFHGIASDWLIGWDPIYAICDQLQRASESVVINIAVASASYSRMKMRHLDYALGSILECAACIDIATIKELLDEPSVIQKKDHLSQMLKMLIGLRKSWLRNMQVSEERAEYSADKADEDSDKAHSTRNKSFFHHEKLQIYKQALTIFRKYEAVAIETALSMAKLKMLDSLCTSVVLNVAEGNGRYSVLDQKKFIEISHVAAVKLAAQLDISHLREAQEEDLIVGLKSKIDKFTRMTSSILSSDK